MLATFVAAVPNAFAQRYEIDSTATKASYETKYLGFVNVRGIFERMTGELRYEPTKPIAERDAFVHVVIDATTLKPMNFDSDSKRRMLRGPEFFNVDKFPTIEFKSKKFRYEGNHLVAIDGDITLVGVTKAATLNVLKSQCEPATASQRARCTASTEWVMKRFEFGMNGWAHTVSDEVKISVELIAVARDDSTKSTVANTANKE